MKALRKAHSLRRKRRLGRIGSVQTKRKFADDPIFRLHELAEPIGPLANAQIDATIYGK